MKSLTCVRNRIPLLISIQTQAKKGIVLTLSLFGLVFFFLEQESTLRS